MKLTHLRKTRIVVSLFVFTFLLLFFLNIHGRIIDPVAEFFLRLQFFPSILRLTAITFAISSLGFLLVLLLTFLFGRVYCSSICPMGTLQDIFIAIARRFKSRKKRRFVYTPNKKLILRYSILSATLLFWIFGSLFLLNLLDPYSNFGKISVTLVQPVFTRGVNILSALLERMDLYILAPMLTQSLPRDVIAVSVGIFGVIFVLSVWRGRLFCNSLCPVGSILGLVSSRSVYRIAFQDEACTFCGKCERVCKAECLDSKNKVVDHGRCVSCFNCFDSCSNNGLYFENTFGSRKTIPVKSTDKNIEAGKRTFLLTVAGGVLSVPLLKKFARAQVAASEPGMIPTGTHKPVTPPGSVSYDHFTNNCIACYLCVGACPTNVIVPSFFDYGLEGFMQPKLDYHKSFCNFDCVRCTEVCPTGAIKKLDRDTKRITQIGIARFMYESCIVTVDRTDCGACSEHCPTKAVTMVPYNGLWLPHVEPDLCIGCGACEFACPTEPYKAIYVESNKTHQTATPIDDDQGPRDHHLDEFPF
ncbi:MAG: 4Fe-4S dicluster domain-containing protein [Bacteroidales bacterium]